MHFHLGIEGILPLFLYGGMWATFAAAWFWRPSIAIYVLAFALPMQTGRYKIHDFIMGSQFVDILILGTVLGLMRTGQSVFPKTDLTRFLFIFAGFYYFSLWEGAFFIGAPLPLWITDLRFSDWKNYVEMFVLAMVVANAIQNKGQVRVLLVCMALSILVVNRNYYSLMSGRDLSHFSYDVRDSGLMGYAGVNGLAAFEAMVSAFLLGLLVNSRGLLKRLAISGLLVTCFYCLLYSFSRGGYAGMIAGMLVIGILRSKILLVSAVFVLLSWQLLLPTSVQERITMTTSDSASGELDSSAEERLTLWKDAVDLFQRNPITGTGFETYEFMGRVGPYKDTHNYYVKVIVETGIVGLFLFLRLLWKLVATGLHLYRASTDSFWQSVGLGFVGLMAASIVLNLFGDRWTYQQVDGYLWIWLGCVWRGLIALDSPGDQKQPAGSENDYEASAANEMDITPVGIYS